MKSIDDIIEKIAQLQDSADRRFFPEGLLESYRSNAFWHYKRPDTNVFFTAITAFTLQKLRPFLTAKTQKALDNIVHKAVLNYPTFQNKDGLMTYNFFQTKPSHHFPHGNILHHLTYFKIPDDIDDTSMVYLSTPHTQAEALWLQQKLSLHANGSKNTIQNTFPAYRSLKAYSTWFGKNMYIEFDACALSNILYCLLSFGLTLDKHGEDSLIYLQECVLSNQYLDQPFRVAHQYARTPLIMYHIVRLMTAFDLAALAQCKRKIIADIHTLLSKNNLGMMDTLLLETSLFRFQIGYRSKLTDEQVFMSEEIRNYPFFIAGFLTAYENPLLYRLASSPLFHIQWNSEAHSWALIAEWMVLKEQAN